VSPTPDHYRARIDRVIDHVRSHPAGDLSLEALARVALFSPFHFHRLFKARTGETLNAFVRRTRVERAAVLMRSAPQRTLTAIARDCGFSALAPFSRAFKEVYGISPSRWNRRSRLQVRKIDQAEGEFPVYSEDEFREMERLFPVRVVPVPQIRVAYVRTLDSYAEGAFQRTYDILMEWAGAASLGGGRVFAMSHDDPDITPAAQCRLDVACEVPDDVEAGGPVSIRTLPATRMAQARCTGEFINIHKIWEYLYRFWLPRSRWEPEDLPSLEYFRTQPADWWRDQVVDLEAWIPVRPLRAV
jgi:AraC family transcriptional regulator